MKSRQSGTNMRKFIIFSIFCLIGVLRASPLTKDNEEKFKIQRNPYEIYQVKYTGDHDIIDILVPVNGLNFEDSNDSKNINDNIENLMKHITIFFVEADVQNGKRVDRGLYVLKNGKAKNILPTGRAAASTSDDKKTAFFGASNGLFSYSADSNSAVKYGPITDGIISIATDKSGKTIYIVTDDHKLYKVSNNGETKELVSGVEDVQEIVLDHDNNIYCYNSHKELFIHTIDGVISVQYLPPNLKSIKHIRPTLYMEHGVTFLFDNSLYTVYANGTSVVSYEQFVNDVGPTAYGSELYLVQYYGIKNKIYEYNYLQAISDSMFNGLKATVKTIHTTATKN